MNLRRFESTPERAIAEIAAMAVLTMMLFGIISMDYNREQENFNRGAILLTAVDAAVFVLPLVWRMNRGAVSRGDIVFAKVGFVTLLFVSHAAYAILGSLLLGRVL